jgi:hypothetical protein
MEQKSKSSTETGTCLFVHQPRDNPYASRNCDNQHCPGCEKIDRANKWMTLATSFAYLVAAWAIVAGMAAVLVDSILWNLRHWR